MRRMLAVATLAVVGALATGCAAQNQESPAGATNAGDGYGDGYGAPQTTAAPRATTAAPAAGGGSGVVSVQGLAFPATVNAKVGQKVTWKNDGSATHTVTADDGLFNGDLPAGGSFSTTFSRAGSYRYHCEIHASMRGTVVVA